MPSRSMRFVTPHEPRKSKTSIGRGLFSKTKMNKHKRRSYKKYRGQGKAT